MRYAGWSSCFRREAGSYGKDTRGIIRVHQFDKVEMFSYCRPEDAADEHQRLLAWEKEMLAKVELPYRVIDIAARRPRARARRASSTARRGCRRQGRYRELTSTSNCTDFQARRLSVRYRDADGRTRPVATLNGTLATTRWIVAILENHQQADGSVRVPEALQTVPRPRGARAHRQMTPPRLIATDLDGTVVRSDGAVSERTKRAFARVESAGSTLVFVTGRPPRWMGTVADALAHRGLAICANGAIVYDLHTESVVGTHTIEACDLEAAVNVLAKALPDLGFAVEHGDGLVYSDGYELANWDAETPQRPVARDELVARPAAKLLARHPELDADALLAEAADLVGDMVLPTHSNGRRLIEMSALGVSKASTLAELCDDQGIPAEDVVAFGDMPNDLPMLVWAGRGYAVANAHPSVLAAVDFTVASNDDDGVARTIEELFPSA